jgi:anti-anti-sigma factor
MFCTLLQRWSKASNQSGPSVTSPESPEQRSFVRRSSARPSRLEVVVRDSSDEVIVCLKGEAGYLEAPALDAALLPLSARRPPLVTFDLSELRLISSLALGILVGYHRRAVHTGGQVRFTGHQPNVRDVIEQTRMTMLLGENCP